MILGVSHSDAYRMRTGRESPTSGYDADRASRGLKKEGTDMSNSIDFEALRAKRIADIIDSTPNADDWLDDWGGVHTLDDGHSGSYAHEAVATTDSVTVTLTCQCGDWSGSAPADTDQAPADLFGQWELHVYQSTGRDQAAEVSESVDERCPCGAVVKDGNPWCSYQHYLEYDLVVEAEELRGERDRLAAEVERLQRRNEDLKAGLLAADADKSRLRESLRGEQFILWGELALFEAKAQARSGRRLKSKMHDDPRVCEAWDAFRDALDEAIRADIAADAGEAL
jgi:hypothetical protein